jgi:RimJ/RimL family protein N-acetyltransferase
MTRNEFEGKLIRLRAIEPEDEAAAHAGGQDTELDRLLDAPHLPSSRAAARRRAEQAAAREPEPDLVELIIETLDGTPVGSLSVGQTDRRNRVFGFGIGLGRDHWRKGYGTEAVVLLLRFYFGELGYQKVDVGVYDFNQPSIRFFEALGFQHEGRRRRAYFTRGRYHDLVLFGMTAEEFSACHGSATGATAGQRGNRVSSASGPGSA